MQHRKGSIRIEKTTPFLSEKEQEQALKKKPSTKNSKDEKASVTSNEL